VSYVSREAIADGYDSCAITSVPAAEVEGPVLDHVQKLLAAPELVAGTWAVAISHAPVSATRRARRAVPGVPAINHDPRRPSRGGAPPSTYSAAKSRLLVAAICAFCTQSSDNFLIRIDFLTWFPSRNERSCARQVDLRSAEDESQGPEEDCQVER
jgi:hypothetical protein